MSGVVGPRLSSIPYPYLLDEYPEAVAAYSNRLLSSTYSGPCLRVRRLFDNTTQDIGFAYINGDWVIDSPALMDFVTGPYGPWSFTGGLYVGVDGWGYVDRWYDQSGNGNYAYRTTFNQQHVIVANGTQVSQFDKDNNRIPIPYLHSYIETPGDPFTTWDKPPLTLSSTISIKSSFVHARVLSQVNINYVYYGSTTGGGGMWYNGTVPVAQGIGFYDGASTFSLTGEDTNSHIAYHDIANGRMLIGKDGTAIQDLGATTNTSINVTHIAGRNDFDTLYLRGFVQEFIFYDKDQSSNYQGITDNMNAYYNLY